MDGGNSVVRIARRERENYRIMDDGDGVGEKERLRLGDKRKWTKEGCLCLETIFSLFSCFSHVWLSLICHCLQFKCHLL